MKEKAFANFSWRSCRCCNKYKRPREYGYDTERFPYCDRNCRLCRKTLNDLAHGKQPSPKSDFVKALVGKINGETRYGYRLKPDRGVGGQW